MNSYYRVRLTCKGRLGVNTHNAIVAVPPTEQPDDAILAFAAYTYPRQDPKVESVFLGTGEPTIPTERPDRKLWTRAQALCYACGWDIQRVGGNRPAPKSLHDLSDLGYMEALFEQERADQQREEARHEAQH